ncbi:DNA polymerase III subunit beta [bacterium]|nr:MAG: DNA polymerase III subunit beta [bacterium]
MQIECLRETILEKVSFLQGAVGRNLSLPILNNVLIKVEDGRIKLSTTNLEIGMTAWIGGKVEESGEITVPVKILANILNNISSEKVILKSNGDNLTVKGDNSKVMLKGMEGKDFPIIPSIKDGFELKLPADKVKMAINKTIFSVSVNETRPELTGILIDIDEKNVNFVGTDSVRLSKFSIEIDQPIGDSKSVIVPSKTMSEVLKGIGGYNGDILCKISENQILFSFNNITIISRIIEGKYPPYNQVIPNNFKTKIVVNNKEFTKALKMAGIFAINRASEIVIKQKDGGKIEISSSAQDLGENSSVINANIQGDNIEILTFNFRYLSEGVFIIDDEEIRFSVSGSESPVIVDSEKNNNFLYLMCSI